MQIDKRLLLLLIGCLTGECAAHALQRAVRGAAITSAGRGRPPAAMVHRVLVMRHAHRYTDTYTVGDDPQLTPEGHRQAAQLATEPWLQRIGTLTAIFTSPWLRSIQTVAPLAAASGMQIRVDRGLGEYLKAEGGHFAQDPLPHLAYQRRAPGASLPGVSAAVIAQDSGAPVQDSRDANLTPLSPGPLQQKR
eukprot:COSAG01_NODE_4648_length_4851_cov_23.573653_1_plen_192_part_00